MSTRCHIALYRETPSKATLHNHNVLLYRHCDGYPGKVTKTGLEKDIGVLPDIIPFLHMFNKRRGINDSEYAGAWLLHHLIEQHINATKKHSKRAANIGLKVNNVEDGKDYLGHGICNGSPNWDIAYFYAISPSSTDKSNVNIQVYEAGFSSKDDVLDGLTLIQTVEVNTKNKKPAVTITINRE